MPKTTIEENKMLTSEIFNRTVVDTHHKIIKYIKEKK